MAYGTIEYSEDGKPKCEICGEYFSRVLNHARYKHFINEKEYKRQFGLDLYKGICSKDSAGKTRETTLRNYDKCVKVNLIIRGDKTRFSPGSKGRTKDKVSEQSRLKLKDQLKQHSMVVAMKKNGQRVGNSKLGNKKRWGNN